MRFRRRRERTGDRLKVMYVVPDLGVGGAERHVTTLLPALDPALFEVSAVCIGEEGALFGDLAAAGVPAKAFHRAKRDVVAAIVDLTREMRRTRPDIVLTRGYNAEAIGRISAALARVPHTVVWVHSCVDLVPRTRARRIADRVLDRVTSAYYGVAQAQLPYLLDDLRYPERKIRIIYNGVETSRFGGRDGLAARAEFGFAPGQPVVGIVASLTPIKDHRTFLGAAQLVSEHIPAARFLVLGDGPLRDELETYAGQLGIAENVVFAGARPDIPQLLAALDLFVLSSESEAFPMSVLEAMAAGLPTVCTAVGGVTEIVVDGETGLTVPPGDPEMLAAAMIRVLIDDELRACMAAAATERVEQEFSLAASVSSSARALLQLGGRERRPIRLTAVMDEMGVGGAEVLILELFKHFDPAVVSPRVLCLRTAGGLAPEFAAAGFEVTVLPQTSKFDPRKLTRLVATLRATDTDVVLVTHHHRAALALGRVAARLGGARRNIVAAHDMDLTSVGKRVLPRWAVDTLGLSDALVLLAASQGEYLHREEGVGRSPLARTREFVVPNGIVLDEPPTSADRERARQLLGLEPGDFAIGIVARLRPQKAHEVLFDAFRRVLDTVPNARLILIGDGERDAELRSLAVELGIAERTTFAGLRRDVPALLPGLDVSCLSSVHEGAPIAVIEAMAAGLPVVATHCGTLPDMVVDGEHGFIVPVGDSAELADRLARLARDPELRSQLGKNGRSRVEDVFQITHTARLYEKLLTELMERP